MAGVKAGYKYQHVFVKPVYTFLWACKRGWDAASAPARSSTDPYARTRPRGGRSTIARVEESDDGTNRAWGAQLRRVCSRMSNDARAGEERAGAEREADEADEADEVEMERLLPTPSCHEAMSRASAYIEKTRYRKVRVTCMCLLPVDSLNKP